MGTGMNKKILFSYYYKKYIKIVRFQTQQKEIMNQYYDTFKAFGGGKGCSLSFSLYVGPFKASNLLIA